MVNTENRSYSIMRSKSNRSQYILIHIGFIVECKRDANGKTDFLVNKTRTNECCAGIR